MKKRLLTAWSCTIALSLASALTLQATPLPIGSTIDLTGSTSASNPTWAGTSVLDENLPFQIFNSSNDVIFTGVLQNRVRKSRETGNLIFSPRIRDIVATNGTARIIGMTLFGFGGFNLDVEYSTDGLGDVGPNQVQRSREPGDSLEFRYTSPYLVPPDESYFLQVVSDTTAFSLTGTVIILVEESPGVGLFVARIQNTAAPIFLEPDRITLNSITRENNGLITLCWTGPANVRHEIQRSADAQNWTTFRARTVKASPACESFFPNSSPDEEYYRVIVPDP